jgi:hypothetical protein
MIKRLSQSPSKGQSTSQREATSKDQAPAVQRRPIGKTKASSRSCQPKGVEFDTFDRLHNRSKFDYLRHKYKLDDRETR